MPKIYRPRHGPSARMGSNAPFAAIAPGASYGCRLDLTLDLPCHDTPTGYIEPADSIEYFLGAIVESRKQSGGLRPNALDVAFLARRYRSEFGMAAIPAAVQRLLFPVLVAVGTLLGRYRKYADAPEPVYR